MNAFTLALSAKGGGRGRGGEPELLFWETALRKARVTPLQAKSLTKGILSETAVPDSFNPEKLEGIKLAAQ